jgi:hypothetical protein
VATHTKQKIIYEYLNLCPFPFVDEGHNILSFIYGSQNLSRTTIATLPSTNVPTSHCGPVHDGAQNPHRCSGLKLLSAAARPSLAFQQSCGRKRRACQRGARRAHGFRSHPAPSSRAPSPARGGARQLLARRASDASAAAARGRRCAATCCTFTTRFTRTRAYTWPSSTWTGAGPPRPTHARSRAAREHAHTRARKRAHSRARAPVFKFPR